MAHNGPEIKNSGLSPRQQSALRILAAAPSIAQASRLCKVGRRTLHRWLQDPEFRDQLAQLQRQSAELAKGCLQSLTFQAVLHLGNLPENQNRESKPENQDPEIRLRAIRAVLNYSAKFSEIPKSKTCMIRSRPWRPPCPFGPPGRNLYEHRSRGVPFAVRGETLESRGEICMNLALCGPASAPFAGDWPCPTPSSWSNARPATSAPNGLAPRRISGPHLLPRPSSAGSPTRVSFSRPSLLPSATLNAAPLSVRNPARSASFAPSSPGPPITPGCFNCVPPVIPAAHRSFPRSSPTPIRERESIPVHPPFPRSLSPTPIGAGIHPAAHPSFPRSLSPTPIGAASGNPSRPSRSPVFPAKLVPGPDRGAGIHPAAHPSFP